MKTISFRIVGAHAEWTSVCGEGDTVAFVFPGEVDGHLSIGRLTRPVKNGSCRIALAEIKDGEYSPVLYLDNATVRLESMTVRANDIRMNRTSERTVRRALERLAALESTVARQEKDLAVLSNAYQNTTIL